MGQVKYAYSYGSNGQLVHIEDVPIKKELRDKSYSCLSCGEKMVARHGEKLAPCFAHKPNDACSGETYLHKLGKALFFQTYTQCLENNKPFELLFYERGWCDQCSDILKGMRCESRSWKRVDLTKWYDQISMEKSINGFVADILLEASVAPQKPLLIEVAVTHTLSSEKQQSGLRIVEIIASREDDLLFLRKPKVVVREGVATKLYNFERILKHNAVIPDQCGAPINVFLLYPTDRCRIKNFTVSEFLKFYEESKGRLKYFSFGRGHCASDCGFGMAYESYIRMAHEKGVKFKNCFLCRYHALGQRKAVFCKFLKDEYPSSRAIECKYFRI